MSVCKAAFGESWLLQHRTWNSVLKGIQRETQKMKLVLKGIQGGAQNNEQ